jgi:hypothetical protein
MLSLRECYEALKDELRKMPRHKEGTGWHRDRIAALVRLEGQMAVRTEAEIESRN